MDRNRNTDLFIFVFWIWCQILSAWCIVGIQKFITVIISFIFCSWTSKKLTASQLFPGPLDLVFTRMNLGLGICEDYFHLIHILLSSFHIFLIRFFKCRNPQQFKQLSALNRNNFPKIEPNRLWAWIKDHKPGTPSRSTSSWGKGGSSLPLPWYLDPSKTQSIQLVSFLSYFSNILLPLGENKRQWKGPKRPQTEVTFAWSPGVTQSELRFSERPLPLTPDKHVFMNQWVLSVESLQLCPTEGLQPYGL